MYQFCHTPCELAAELWLPVPEVVSVLAPVGSKKMSDAAELTEGASATRAIAGNRSEYFSQLVFMIFVGVKLDGTSSQKISGGTSGSLIDIISDFSDGMHVVKNGDTGRESPA
jgi:hypothetical protein